MPYGLLKIFTYSILNQFTLPHPFLPSKTRMKVRAHVSPWLSLPPDPPWCLLLWMALCGVVYPLLSQTGSHKLSSQWQSSHHL